MDPTSASDWPRVRTLGVDGFLVSFADRLSEPANRAALALRAEIEDRAPEGVEETSTSLASTYLRFDPLVVDHATIEAMIRALLGEVNWYEAPLPGGRRLWRVPTVYGGDMAPQLEEAAKLAGLGVEAAIASLSTTRVRVQTIGFAPGMPYLGELSQDWDIPRQTTLTEAVEAGGLCVAIRQMVLFPVRTPTGWRQVGQTAFPLFRPGTDQPFTLNPGDEVIFEAVDPDALEAAKAQAFGGARSEVIR